MENTSSYTNLPSNDVALACQKVLLDIELERKTLFRALVESKRHRSWFLPPRSYEDAEKMLPTCAQHLVDVHYRKADKQTAQRLLDLAQAAIQLDGRTKVHVTGEDLQVIKGFL